MEINKSNVNPHSENYARSNTLTLNTNHKIDSKNKLSKRSINMSLLTTKTDDVFDKITISDKKINTIFNQNSHLEDDSIFDNLKTKGLLNKTLEIKIDEYKKDLKKTLKQDGNTSKIALIKEINLIKKNIQIAKLEQENLNHLKDLKEKKIDILENSILSINQKIKSLKGKIDKRTKTDNNEDKGNNKIKKNSLNKNWKNILSQHYEIFSYDLLKNLSMKGEEKDPVKLEKELTNLKINNEMQMMNIKEHLNIKNIIAANNKKLEFEKEINQLKNDNFFLENNLYLEKEALSRKLSKYKELINKNNNRTDNQSFQYNDNGVILENNTYNLRKTAYLDKINYLKNLIKNSNVNLLTSNNSIVTKKGDFANFNNLFTKTNNSLDNCGINLDELNTIIFEKNDFLQINSAKQNDKYLIKKQPSYKNLSFEIGLSNINSP